MKRILLVSVGTLLLAGACSNDEQVDEVSYKKHMKEMKKEEKKENDKTKDIKSDAKEVNSNKFENKQYKHEAHLKISNAEVNGVYENDLGMQEATLVTKKNDVITGSYTAVNYSDVKWENQKLYTVYGTYDLKHEDEKAAPSIDVEISTKK